MEKLVSPAVVAVAFIAALFALVVSPNGWMWFVCILALPPMLWLCGEREGSAVFVFVLSIAWLQIVTNVALTDHNGMNYNQSEVGPYIERADIYGLLAILTIAAGLQFGGRILGNGRRSGDSTVADFDLSRLFICYAACAAFAGTLDNLASRFLPGAQALHSLGLIRFACVYLIAAVVLRRGQGYGWLLAVVVIEVGTGMIGFFAGYKEAIFVILIAGLSMRRYVDGRMVAVGAVAVLGVIWMSMVWIVIKFDYRPIMFEMSVTERAAYVANRYIEGVDYDEAIQKLLERVEYTTIFGNVVAYRDAGLLNEHDSYYLGALEHVSTPRIFFPDKASLSDSQKTSDLLGISIAEDTSIGIGFVAEAYADFGFPGMLLPMFAIGILFSLAARYFVTRNAPLFVCEALATAAFFLPFSFATNIDKALGGFLTNWLAFALALKFGYPMIAPWLFQRLPSAGRFQVEFKGRH